MNNVSTAVGKMVFVKISACDYWDEPYIEFTVDDPAVREFFDYSEFMEIIATCKRFGIDHDHLTIHLPQFEREIEIYNKMLPSQPIAAAM